MLILVLVAQETSPANLGVSVPTLYRWIPASSRVQGTLEEGVPTNFISREHLIQYKLASGRHIDLHDVDAL
jgi:hypothetical protein